MIISIKMIMIIRKKMMMIIRKKMIKQLHRKKMMITSEGNRHALFIRDSIASIPCMLMHVLLLIDDGSD